ncbi:MAG: hypothetical protein A2Y25_07305 [Candidatus Melainabacteria bacterium GWF2_37_15]|nr:MAG: hypothetical protein A2Y25_07305 [Candidatus Melainabacteria bacterium GWF2_37_15]
MSIKKEIKHLLVEQDITLTELAKRIGTARNEDYAVQNLSKKINRETITYKEVELIAEILGYKIKFERC